MMKRFMLLAVMVIVLAVAAPVFAGPFSDVPENHWAYQALNKVASTGIVTGYADGTFKGSKTLTRYEIAIIVSRILDQVAAERALLAEKVDALENGLTAGQAEDTIAIFKSLLAKERQSIIDAVKVETPVVVEKPTVEEPKTPEVANNSLTEVQAAEVAAIVEALVMEFRFELDAIGARLDAIEGNITSVTDRVAKLEAEVAKKPSVTWSGSYDVTVDRTKFEGIGEGEFAYYDPFKKDFDGDGYWDADETKSYQDSYTANEEISHSLTLNMGVKTANLSANFELGTVYDPFATDEETAALTLSALKGTITGDNFSAVVDDYLEVKMISYLFGHPLSKANYDGIKATIGNDVYAFLAHDGKSYFAAQKSLGLLNSTMYVGTEDLLDDPNFVVGLKVPVSLLGINVTTDVAAEKLGEEFAKYLTVNAKTSLGALNIEGNYTKKDDNFDGIQSRGMNSNGYDASADMKLFGDALALNGRYNSYDYNQYGFGAEFKKGILSANFDMDKASQEAAVEGEEPLLNDRMQYGASVDTKVWILGAKAGYKYDQYTDNITGVYVDGNGNALPQYNNAFANLKADLFIPGLSATANYRYSLEGDKFVSVVKDEDGNVIKENPGISQHSYGLAFAKGIFSSNFDYNMLSKRTYVGAKLDPAAYNVLGVSIDTVAGVKMENTAAKLYNYNVGVELKKALNEKSNLTYGFVYDDRNIGSIAADDELLGMVKKHTASVDYAITADLKAAIEYTSLDFDSKTDAEDYRVQSLTSGLSLSF